MHSYLFQKKIRVLLLFIGVILLAVNCNNPNLEDAPLPSPSTPISERSNIPDNGYPSPENSSGYPSPSTDNTDTFGYPHDTNVIEGLSSTPPNPSFDLPVADENYGIVGGVLVQEIVGQGYLPLEPVELSLAEVIKTTDGNPAFIRENSDSPKAELFPTGIFIFKNVPPGDYGFMVDVGYAKFPIRGSDGNQILVTVEAGQSIDLGQLITELP